MDDNKPKKSLLTIKDLNHKAQQDWQDGAVTQDYRLNRIDACTLLNEALASEIVCVLRYHHHQIIARGMNKPQVAAEFAEHANDETKHMMMIAERINQLGGNPDFNPATLLQRSTTEYGDGGDLETLIRKNLVAERVAIMIYRKLIVWFGHDDPTTRRMLEDILKDEEDHADDLSDFLA